MNEDHDTAPQEQQQTKEPSAWANIAKILFLVAVLAAAWWLLEKVFSGK